MYVEVETKKKKNNSGFYKGVWETDLVPYKFYILNFVPCVPINSKGVYKFKRTA